MIEELLNIILEHSNKLYIATLRKKGVTIGPGTRFFGRVFIDQTTPELVKIGSDCVLTDGVKILTHDWVYSVFWHIHKEADIQDIYGQYPVTIKDNVYVGTNALILKNVTIGKNTIIGAGSVVTRSIPANSVAVGNPCRVIMTVEEYHQQYKQRFTDNPPFRIDHSITIKMNKRNKRCV